MSACTNVTCNRLNVGDIIIRARRYKGSLSKALCMHVRRVLGLLAASIVVCATAAYSQDAQSLGAAARQARLQKQQKEAKAKEAPVNSNDAQPAKPPKRVVTNDDIPEHVGSTLTSRTPRTSGYVSPSYGPRPAPADQWKSMIEAQKNSVAYLQREIDKLTESIQHPENCLTDCAQRNVSQRMKEQQLESMQAQLEQQQKRLEDFQELIRKQGFGSAVYDP
jgi:septal ring factor EnvC (AmiA/AmiB activator)